MLDEYDIYNVKKDFLELINNEKNKPYFKEILMKLDYEYEKFNVYPNKNDVFNAFKYCDFYKVKCVFLGLDPYHGKNQANGLSFSVKKDVKIPQSLRNIFKEYNEDLGYDVPKNGDLSMWAKEGVLLMNCFLTVREGEARSHNYLNWALFTDFIIEKLSKDRENIVFILLGLESRKKKYLIDEKKHLIIESGHPSFASVHKQFFGCKIFSKTNNYLKQKSIDEINFNLS